MHYFFLMINVVSKDIERMHTDNDDSE